MKALYIECNMGAAGDMLMSALSEIHPDPEDFMKRLNSLNIPHVKVERQSVLKCGITGTHISVTVDGHMEDENMHSDHHFHHHTGLKEIKHIIEHLALPEKVKKDILSVYLLIAEAESAVHGKTADQINFHEIGSMDALTDITGVCMLINELAPDKIIVSPIHVGAGQVKCAHGILPAPATAHILKGVPIYGGNIQGELCTPTGAALLKYFADEFGIMPVMKISKIGYGMGSRNYETANCLRAMLGEDEEKEDTVIEMSCNIDDMTAEEISFAAEKVFQAGALDVFTIPVGMKKCRLGTLFSCICRTEDRDKVAEAVFRYTSTIGIRWSVKNRFILDRTETEIRTEYGSVSVKRSHGFGTERIKTEYDDIAMVAENNGISIREARALIKKGINDNGYKSEV